MDHRYIGDVCSECGDPWCAGCEDADVERDEREAEQYSIVLHNAVGTVYGFIREFMSPEQARAYQERHAYAGVDGPIIKTRDEPEIRRLNDSNPLISGHLYVYISSLPSAGPGTNS